MHKKNILICLIAVIAIITFSIVSIYTAKDTKEVKAQEDKVYETSSYINDQVKSNTQECDVNLCLNEEYTPQKLKNDADEIVIASVISLDSAVANEGLFGMTKGKILIQKCLVGDLQSGQVIEYAKNGGVLKMSDWEKTQPEAANKKRAYLREKEGVNIDLDSTYINIQLADDIGIEEGNTYLMYLKKYDSAYEIMGLNVGLRQVNIPKSSTITAQKVDENTLEIKNNKTGEFESLGEYINTYIKSSAE